ncbi:MAG TPA: alkaline phosphatase D family protein [Candidatus Tectomicrobia bacterium]|nr:alkaline phosphatase D family protein [Candidatus Tectomicrobia bacterium]
MQEQARVSRRVFLSRLAIVGAATLASSSYAHRIFAQGSTPAVIIPDAKRPAIPYGVASGDVTGNAAIIWSRTDRPGRMIVEYATTDSFKNPKRVVGPAALVATDFTARVDLTDLPPGQEIFYRVMFQDLVDVKSMSVPVIGHLKTAPAQPRDITFMWGGDTAGQGWGINLEWGGMRVYEQMRRLHPDFFIHNGDSIYADNPIAAEVKLDDGTIWKNLTTPEKAKVAETLAEFRGNYVYNLMDEHIRAFNAEVTQFFQWDDHEVTNNWFPGGVIDERNPRYEQYMVKSHDLLAANAKRAFLEYLPLRLDPQDPERIYRAFSYGPALDVFMLDERSYRGPNSPNRQETSSAATSFLGTAQLRWLKRALLASDATWKVIASDMPLGLLVPDVNGFEAWANGDGSPLGRELELAGLLGFIRANDIGNVVWLTADVHYAAAHYYDPAKAQFSDFKPFWEFVAGPLHAGTFGPNKLDYTFGPEVKFLGIPEGLKPNRPPSEGMQFFGILKIDGKSEVMTVSLHNLQGAKIYSVELIPEA